MFLISEMIVTPLLFIHCNIKSVFIFIINKKIAAIVATLYFIHHMLPSNMLPSNMLPSNMLPSNMLPSNMLPSNK